MKKNGMTLVELLVVVGILSMLVLITLPNALNAYKNSKKKNFITDVQTVFKTAVSQSKVDNYGKRENSIYARINGETPENFLSLELTGSTKMDYLIVVSFTGEVLEYAATDGEFQYYFANPISDVSEITDESIKEISELGDSEKIDVDTISNKYIIYK